MSNIVTSTTKDEFEILTPQALIQVQNDLKSELDWVRIRAQEMILSRTRPTRDVRATKFDFDKLETLVDLSRVARNIFFNIGCSD